MALNMLRTPTMLATVALFGCAADSDVSGGSGGQELVCDAGDEDIELDSLFEYDLVEDVSCVVGADAFDCDGEMLDLGPLFEPFTPLPWAEGDTVQLTAGAYFFEVSELVVRNGEGDLLAVYAEARPPGSPEAIAPLRIDVEPAPTACQDQESREIALRTTYTVDEESVTLTGSISDELPGFRIYQARAEDITETSAGEVAEMVSFVAIAQTDG